MIQCPQCKREIPPADFNISTDIAFCRQCNKQYCYSELGNIVSSRSFDYSSWPRHLKYSTDPEGEQITYRKLSPIILFLVPFCALWSGGSMYGIYIKPIMDHNLTWGGALFGIPFLIGTLFMLSLIVLLLFGAFKVRVGSSEAWYGWSVLGLMKKKHFDPRLIASVQLVDSTFRRNNVRQQEIVLTMKDGQEVKFGAMMDEECRRKLAEYLAQKRF